MIRLLSKKFELPLVYLISNRNDLSKLPIGVPFIFGDISLKEDYIKLLEFEVIYEACVKTGLKFNFRTLLKEAGYEDLQFFNYQKTVYSDYKGTAKREDIINMIVDNNTISDNSFKKFVKDASVVIDLEKIKQLGILPIWLSNHLDAISINVDKYMEFNYGLYNKKLEGVYGDFIFKDPEKSLLNFDISASIPKGIATSFTLLSKFFAESLYCDIIFTGRKTIFIPYEEIPNINLEEIYNKYGNNQECVEFRKLITENPKSYRYCITMGDNHSVCGKWNSNKEVSREEGKKLCQWNIEHLICFHTTEEGVIPGFADWFSPKTVEHVKDWKKYLID